MDGWKYYNRAMIPNCAPHEKADIEAVKSGIIFNDGVGKKAVLARWTEDFDCGYKTEWWYCIKDIPFDIDSLNAKKRYEIKHGEKFFEVKSVNYSDYLDEFVAVRRANIASYSKNCAGPEDESKVRANFIKDSKDANNHTFAAFFRETGQMCGWADIHDEKSYFEFVRMMILPEFQKFGISAALVFAVLEYYKEDIANGKYINDGARNIRHQTEFQNYLCKYFNFRLAYCNLNVKYRSVWIKLLIYALFPIRAVLGKSKKQTLYNVYCVLKQEEICRAIRKEKKIKEMNK